MKSVEGGYPFSGDQPPSPECPGKYDGTAEPGVSAATPLDPKLAPNRFPRESGSDHYTGIPGDGVVGN